MSKFKSAMSATSRGLKSFGTGLGNVLAEMAEQEEQRRAEELVQQRESYIKLHREATSRDVQMANLGFGQVNPDATVCILHNNCPFHSETVS